MAYEKVLLRSYNVSLDTETGYLTKEPAEGEYDYVDSTFETRAYWHTKQEEVYPVEHMMFFDKSTFSIYSKRHVLKVAWKSQGITGKQGWVWELDGMELFVDYLIARNYEYVMGLAYKTKSGYYVIMYEVTFGAKYYFIFSDIGGLLEICSDSQTWQVAFKCNSALSAKLKVSGDIV